MISIKNINWLNKETSEAEVVLTDGKVDVLSFSSPFSLSNKFNLIYAFDTEHIIRGENGMFLEKQANYTYIANGLILDLSKRLIKIGEFLIQLDIDLPGDLHNNEYICFSCQRFDLF